MVKLLGCATDISYERSTARVVEEFIFGKDNLSWMSGSALSEAGLLADYMILRTGMTALGKVYYRTQQDVMLHVSVVHRHSVFNLMVVSVNRLSNLFRRYLQNLNIMGISD